ncbi:collagen alpha-1(X) chain-like, partial [Cygnus olor]|uniref:collagen alpha-1(X) chain-like n=1 Tax=Cygnus olor TaxID=8869 RepID=UPI001ADE5244
MVPGPPGFPGTGPLGHPGVTGVGPRPAGGHRGGSYGLPGDPPGVTGEGLPGRPGARRRSP